MKTCKCMHVAAWMAVAAFVSQGSVHPGAHAACRSQLWTVNDKRYRLSKHVRISGGGPCGSVTEETSLRPLQQPCTCSFVPEPWGEVVRPTCDTLQQETQGVYVLKGLCNVSRTTKLQYLLSTRLRLDVNVADLTPTHRCH